jgi:Beta-propeller repeat/RTX calcium-binding nonapeptide repeat (4 copies)
MRGFPGRTSRLVTACGVAAAVLGGITSAGTVTSKAPVGEDERARVLKDFARTPVSFEENRGQTDPRVRYLTRGTGYTLYLTEQEAVFSLSGAASESGAPSPSPTPPGAALRMALAGTDSGLDPAGESPLPGVVSYFKGSNPEGWHPGIPTFARVRYRGIYPGTDLLFRGTREALEYDFLLAPGADPGRIALRFEGAEDLRIDRRGDLVITTAVGELVHRAPVVYQQVKGERQEITGAYRLYGDQVGFALGSYDRARPLVIDPVVLRYSTFLGGVDEDQGLDIAVDPYTRHAYVTGTTDSTDFPTTPGPFDSTFNGSLDAFVTKLGPTGATLSYSTYLGGSGQDEGRGIALDGAGGAYVTGSTASTDFPTTAGAFDQTHNGEFDVFVTKLAPTGATLAYSTFLGGSRFDLGNGIAVDTSGAAYVTGVLATVTEVSTDFPTTPGAFDRTVNGGDAFVAKLAPTGTALAYSTFLGGSSGESGQGIAVDGAGAAYLVGLSASTDFPTTPAAFDQTHNGGSDSYVTKLSPTGATLSYSTLLGGSAGDFGAGITVDAAGAAYVTGSTESTDFPTTPGAFDQTHNGEFDVFVTKLGPTGVTLAYSTLLGGSRFDFGNGIAVDAVRAAYVTGTTFEAVTDFPTTPGAFDRTHNGHDDVFVTKLAPTGAGLAYSTYLGDSSFDAGFGIAVDDAAAYVTGTTRVGTDFPTTPGAFDRTFNGRFDAFVTKLVEPTPPPPPGSALTCRGRTATLIGTVGDDSMTGTSGSDVIVALAGGDVVKALGGSDVICAGDGHDIATGGLGRDTIQGEDGKDRLAGGGGDDKLSGGNGIDTCLGGSGRNVARNCEKEKSIP